MTAQKEEKHSADPFIQKSDSKFLPEQSCMHCDNSIPIQDTQLLFINEDNDPCCEEHSQQSVEVVRLEKHSGYPWNGRNPETDELQYFEFSHWYEVESRISLSDATFRDAISRLL